MVNGSILKIYILLSILPVSETKALQDFFDSPVFPSSGYGWVSLDHGVEFKPAVSQDSAVSDEKSKAIRRAQMRLFSYHEDMFVDSYETHYDAYSQAWRFLGFFVDCNSNEDENRKLANNDAFACVRYALWAAVRRFVMITFIRSRISHFHFFTATVHRSGLPRRWDRRIPVL
jgi:hypothetical protein